MKFHSWLLKLLRYIQHQYTAQFSSHAQVLLFRKEEASQYEYLRVCGVYRCQYLPTTAPALSSRSTGALEGIPVLYLRKICLSLQGFQTAIVVIQVRVHFLLNIGSCSTGMAKAAEFNFTFQVTRYSNLQQMHPTLLPNHINSIDRLLLSKTSWQIQPTHTYRMDEGFVHISNAKLGLLSVTIAMLKPLDYYNAFLERRSS